MKILSAASPPTALKFLHKVESHHQLMHKDALLFTQIFTWNCFKFLGSFICLICTEWIILNTFSNTSQCFHAEFHKYPPGMVRTLPVISQSEIYPKPLRCFDSHFFSQYYQVLKWDQLGLKTRDLPHHSLKIPNWVDIYGSLKVQESWIKVIIDMMLIVRHTQLCSTLLRQKLRFQTTWATFPGMIWLILKLDPQYFCSKQRGYSEFQFWVWFPSWDPDQNPDRQNFWAWL